MGMSNLSAFLPPSGDPAQVQPETPNFGDRMGTYAQSHYPVAGGLANAIFGGSNSSQPQPQANLAYPQLAGQAQQANPMMPAVVEQPKQDGGGLSTLLKLFAGV